MKQDIHPDYQQVLFYDSAVDTGFVIGSTLKTSKTMEWKDGKTYPVCFLDTSSASHPFYTGKQAVIKSEGRLAKFKDKFSGFKKKG